MRRVAVMRAAEAKSWRRISPLFCSGPSCVQMPTWVMVSGPANSFAPPGAASATVAVSSHSPRTPPCPVSSSRSARAGAAARPGRISHTSPLNDLLLRATFRPASALREVRARVGDLGPGIVRAFRDLDDLAIVLPGLRRVAGLNGGLGGTRIGAEPVRLLLQRRLEGRKRLLRHAALDEHEAVELARGLRHAGRHRVLLGLVLGVRRGAHRLQRLVVLALR